MPSNRSFTWLVIVTIVLAVVGVREALAQSVPQGIQNAVLDGGDSKIRDALKDREPATASRVTQVRKTPVCRYPGDSPEIALGATDREYRIVAKGETLAGICLGDRACLKRALELNPQVTDADCITAGRRIIVPKAAASANAPVTGENIVGKVEDLAGDVRRVAGELEQHIGAASEVRRSFANRLDALKAQFEKEIATLKAEVERLSRERPDNPVHNNVIGNELETPLIPAVITFLKNLSPYDRTRIVIAVLMIVIIALILWWWPKLRTPRHIVTEEEASGRHQEERHPSAEEIAADARLAAVASLADQMADMLRRLTGIAEWQAYMDKSVQTMRADIGRLQETKLESESVVILKILSGLNRFEQQLSMVMQELAVLKRQARETVGSQIDFVIPDRMLDEGSRARSEREKTIQVTLVSVSSDDTGRVKREVLYNNHRVAESNLPDHINKCPACKQKINETKGLTFSPNPHAWQAPALA